MLPLGILPVMTVLLLLLLLDEYELSSSCPAHFKRENLLFPHWILTAPEPESWLKNSLINQYKSI